MTSRSRNRRDQRDVPNTVAREPLETLLGPPVRPSPVLLDPPVESPREDRRFYHPDQDYRPALTARAARAVIKPLVEEVREAFKRPRPFQQARQAILGTAYAFRSPGQVWVCIRRKARREVLHAFKLTRKGSGAGKRKHYHSDVRC